MRASANECVRVRRLTGAAQPADRTGPERGPRVSEFTLLIDGIPSGRIESRLGLRNFVSWTGLDIGRDRASPVPDYARDAGRRRLGADGA
jgi:hypothetical protein